MTGEIGQLALCLALALSLVQAVPASRARAQTLRARAVASSAALGMFVFVALAFGALIYRASSRRISAIARCRAEFAHAEAADLQDHRRVGKPRRLDAAVGAGAVDLFGGDRAARGAAARG